MKDLHMLVWLTQVGISVAAPPVVSLLIGFWLRNRFDLGAWCILVAFALGRQRPAANLDADGEDASAKPQGSPVGSRLQ